MRRLAASMASSRMSSSDAFSMQLGNMDGCGGSSVVSSSYANGVGSGAVGNVLIGSEGSGVMHITFEQHSALVRYPNSMSNLRRLRCYLLACQVCFLFSQACMYGHVITRVYVPGVFLTASGVCAYACTCLIRVSTRAQGHHFEYQNYLEEIVPKDVARALSDNPVSIPDVKSVYLGIESLAMNIRPFDELNQFRTRCFLSFASHQKSNLTLTQVLKLYVSAYQVSLFMPIDVVCFRVPGEFICTSRCCMCKD